MPCICIYILVYMRLDTYADVILYVCKHLDIKAHISNTNTQEDDDEIVLDITKTWVKAIIADFAVCPFTVEPERAGIPRGNVRYTGNIVKMFMHKLT